MLEHHFGHLALQVEEARHAELLAMAEHERRGAPALVRPERRGRRVLGRLGAWLVAAGEYLEHAADVRRPELSRWL